ncbi:MAG: DUF6265 family protein [Cyclobacteriaceae bacterium]
MKTTIILFALLLTASLQAQKLKDFKWLEGTWERQGTKVGSTAFESWTYSNDGLKGEGLTLKGADTVFVEKLSLIMKDNKLFYVAEVSHNTEPTYFEITSVSKTGFICENPDHDFPKKIEYAFTGTEMIATISGDGKDIPFRFKKLDE